MSSKNCEKGASPEPPKGCWAARYTFTLMACFGFVNLYTMRAFLSVAIVAMVTHDNSTEVIEGQCPVGNKTDIEESGSSGSFDWTSGEQGFILSSFFYGYASTQIIGGYLAEKYSGKWVFGLGVFLTAVSTILGPVLAFQGTGWLIGSRVVAGICSGVALPSMHTLIAKWIPDHERGKLATFIWSGSQMGTVMSMILTGYLAADINWETAFYFFGGFGILWFIIWIFLVYDSPARHPWMKEDEVIYIQCTLPPTTERKDLPFPPLRHIFTSLPFYAILIAHGSQAYVFNNLLTQAPSYMSNMQHFSLKENGVLSALPHIVMWVCSIILGTLSDMLLVKGYLSKRNIRRLFNSIGSYGPTCGLIWLAFVGCSKTMAVAALCVSVGLGGGCFSGWQVNHVDLSPNYAGTMLGFTNTLASMTGFISPLVTGVITKEETLENWSIVFLSSAAIYAAGNTFYIIFCKAELQPWNTFWQQPEKKKSRNSISLSTVS